ncbi:serine/threonine-protein kinase 31 isoform X2 [Hyla sarda]|nr:serine/threonine-protein kinase 31 isoform X2 [Hyla sarda]XP_056375782.1 serine/threonine-protein kinase 31 isoform X2 [Hyla sarda]XP_056375783.1 serine/threonine-protein kinase 31 isoform X2 [Hyla sarda]
MEGDISYNKAEDVYVSHVEDAVTFWGQSIDRIHDISKISDSLAKVCPTGSAVFGTPDLDKVYGGMFSADKCWYRCKVQHVVSDEQCSLTYIDYGNSEVLERSSIVELPEELQSPPIAQKYRLWGLQLQTASDIEQGIKFLTQLVGDKTISVQQKATYKDGTVVVQVTHNNLDIGEELAKKGFAVKCRLVGSPNGAGETMDVAANEIKSPFAWQARNRERLPMREPKSLPMFNRCSSDLNKENVGKSCFQPLRSPSAETNGVRSDQRWLEENKQLNDVNKQLKDEITLLKNEKKQKLDEYRQLKEDKEILLEKLRGLELHVQTIQIENKKEKELFEKNINEMEKCLASAAGNKLKALAAKIDILKSVRRENTNVTLADDLLDAVKVVGSGQLSAPSSLNALEKTWEEYSFAQEMIRECSDVVELDMLIDRRNKVKEQLNSFVDAFVIEVDQLPLESRLEELKVLLNSLQIAYGASCNCEDSDAVFQEFYNWKQEKVEKFSTVRSDTDSSVGLLDTWLSDIRKFFDLHSSFSLDSCDILLDIDDILEKINHSTSKELKISLVEPDEDEQTIITNAYNRVVKLIYEEITLISALKAKYLASVEFKKNMSEWINKNPNVDDLMTVKKSIKSLKAQLRWKLLESSSMEESDEYNATAHSEVKHEIATIRNKIFCEIQQEQEEYALLSDLVQKWFPELPLMYSDVGITCYMNSGGLLSGSMERELFDAEPLKELSNKRPLVCTHLQNQKVLLKGYSVGADTEEQVIMRVSEYHKAWSQQKEESGIMKLLYLFFCKSDPVVYLMVPFYPGESLGYIQANNKLSLYEAMKVMRGVAHGLHTLHASNLIVGSLHENNVFAVNRVRGIVGDFDFTRDAEQRSSATSICFPLLTAPEVKLGQPASAFSDVYAYGILLLWLCMGNKNIMLKSDGTPDLEKLDLDSKMKTLLSGLVCCGDRMQAEHIKSHECFQITEAAFTPLPIDNEETDDSTPADFA